MRNAKSRRGNQILAAAVGAAGVMGFVSASQATIYTSVLTGSNTGNWNVAATWTPNSSYPGLAGDKAIVNSGIVIANVATNADFTMDIGTGGTVNVSGGSWFGSGTINLLGGTLGIQAARAVGGGTAATDSPALFIGSAGGTLQVLTNSTNYATLYGQSAHDSTSGKLVWSGTGKLTVDAKNSSIFSGTFSSVSPVLQINGTTASSFSGDIDVITGKGLFETRGATADGNNYVTGWHGAGTGNWFVASGAMMAIRAMPTSDKNIVYNVALVSTQTLSGAGTFDVGDTGSVGAKTLKLADGAAIAPGTARGGAGAGTATLTIGGSATYKDNLVFEDGADLKLDWASGGEAGTMDKLIVLGSAKSGATNNLSNLDIIVSGAGVFGKSYQVMTVGTAWATAPTDATLKNITSGWKVDTTNTNTTALWLTPVPEPTSAAGLLASGALMALRRKKRT